MNQHEFILHVSNHLRAAAFAMDEANFDRARQELAQAGLELLFIGGFVQMCVRKREAGEPIPPFEFESDEVVH